MEHRGLRWVYSVLCCEGKDVSKKQKRSFLGGEDMNKWCRVKSIRGLLYGIALLSVFGGLALCCQSAGNAGYAQDKTEHVHKFQLRKAVWLTGYDDDYVFHEDVNIKFCGCGEIITIFEE